MSEPSYHFSVSEKEQKNVVMNDPIKKRFLAKKIVQSLNLKLKTHNLDSSDEWKVICPFHQEKTPQGSMYISPEKFVFHCFSCQAEGSLSTMYYRLTGRSFYKDFNILNDEFSSFSFNSSSIYSTPDYSKLDRNVSIHISGSRIPVEKSTEGISYLRSRGIPLDIAKSMQMEFMNYGTINGTVFNKRLLIPIYENNKLLAVEGRDVTGSQVPKVLYPKSSTVQTLYDLDTLKKSEALYVVEGLTKLAVLRSDPYFANSTATFGSGLSERQIWLLQQFDKVVIIPDNDEAGKRSVRKLKDTLEKPFEILEIPKLDGIKDVGDIPQKLHTTVKTLRDRGWGRKLKSSLTLIFY